MYGRATQNAIAAVSRLAEVYDDGATRLSADEIATTRGLQKPFVSKLLSILSTAGIVNGTRGPGGGFTLARHPREIRLYDVFTIFEREDAELACPFGGGVCGSGDPCPLHNKLVAVQDRMNELLSKTTFDVFRVAYQEKAATPTRKTRKKTTKKTTTKKKVSKKKVTKKRSRASYRAPAARRKL